MRNTCARNAEEPKLSKIGYSHQVVMSRRDVDDAFEWLVLVFGIVNAIMVSYPEYFFWGEMYGMPASEVAVKSAVLPLLVTALVWIVGKLATDRRLQVIAKLTAWMFALGVVYGRVFSYLGGAEYISLSSALMGLNMIILSFLIPVFTYVVVMPRYREMYPDSKLLRSKTLFVIVFIFYVILNFSLLMILPRPT